MNMGKIKISAIFQGTNQQRDRMTNNYSLGEYSTLHNMYLIIQACNKITEDMCHRVINITVRVKKLSGVMVVILNTLFTEDKSPCNGLSLYVLVSSIVIEIKIVPYVCPVSSIG
jgi:hypothetical protein